MGRGCASFPRLPAPAKGKVRRYFVQAAWVWNTDSPEEETLDCGWAQVGRVNPGAALSTMVFSLKVMVAGEEAVSCPESEPTQISKAFIACLPSVPRKWEKVVRQARSAGSTLPQVFVERINPCRARSIFTFRVFLESEKNITHVKSQQPWLKRVDLLPYVVGGKQKVGKGEGEHVDYT
ncbi:hypothetical protein NDU88_005827 [Pleurodeles waltl]|uniref:Uncharacterized protein n=1 Tax=Pleurodeles waltl TaxID=8319 RepID=A0AAV7QH48_PLEWA|nr:hypothetical protein NDU88_005827 [Pleurodeles waltl]